MSSWQPSRGRRRYEEPTERYDIDGTLRRVTPEPKTSSEEWNLKDVLQDPERRALAIKEAQAFVRHSKDKHSGKERVKEDAQGGKLEQPSARTETDEADPWSRELDDQFFSRRGCASDVVPRGSPDYYDFRDFFVKLKGMREQKLSAENIRLSKAERAKEMVERMRHALVLFDDFRKKKLAAQREKISKDRAALPIAPYKDQIVSTLRQHRVVLVAGDTGCGKTTQVPQFLMEAGFRRIACTQPRRIACQSLARRVGYETMNEFGSEIAYQVRFETTKSRTRTRILFLTEGLLLRQVAVDPLLERYDVIIVDEIHERHVMGDLLLGVLKRIMRERQNLYVVLMSATINAALFASYFGATTIEVPGRMYPVEIEYVPHGGREDRHLVDEQLIAKRRQSDVPESVPAKSEQVNAEPYLRIMERIDQQHPPTEAGDLLVFMSGINEIMTLADELKLYANYTKAWIILMLHSSLSIEAQDKVFDVAPPGVRKCIIASNIAETSVTIDGIRWVIDSGRVKELTHDTAFNMSRLKEFWISRASAKQRAGRCGRVGPGHCFRFYSRREFDGMNEFAVPEILRAPLEPIILEIRALNMGDPRKFDFIERPSDTALAGSIRLLQRLGALDSEEHITSLGQVLSALPLDAVLGKMLIMGLSLGLLDPVLTCVAGMSVQSPFLRSVSPRIAQNRQELESEEGDAVTLLRLWGEWMGVKADRGESSKRWCKRMGVEEQRMYEITKLKRQFEGVLNQFCPGSVAKGKLWEKGGGGEEERRRRREKREVLRREKYLQQSAKRRKILRFEEENAGDRDDETFEPDNEGIDVHDLEFSLQQDVNHLRESAEVAHMSREDLNLLKLVICSGLYPQLAIADVHNPHRKASEQMFHTPTAKFLSVHPTSVYFANAEWLHPKDDKRQAARQHELLVYLEILETNRPYLVNLTRVPGVHILLLLAQHIDTDAACTTLVMDDFYLVRFRDSEAAVRTLSQIVRLRCAWWRGVEARLLRIGGGIMATMPRDNEQQQNVVPEGINLPEQVKRWHREWGQSQLPSGRWRDWEVDEETEALSDKLKAYFATWIECDFEQAMPSDLNLMFPMRKAGPVNPQLDAWDPSEVVKDGVPITPWLRWNSIRPPGTLSTDTGHRGDKDEVDVNAYHRCPWCGKEEMLARAEAEEHERTCQGRRNLESVAEEEGEKVGRSEERSGRGKEYKCQKCGQIYFFSPVEILRHIKGCTGR
ncbi:uncharacterized protein VTP21DRAFT_2305 [Calcarisporiella thermophila]|uniref:uncharacterized protein n=1 Tax=Calcarisporiella thermophila TaxID=911321 RepID=UPI003743B80D